tara:strand:+ start:104 stop:379 length:276 start_codon:yes stop_codon:yes gene_type:complete
MSNMSYCRWANTSQDMRDCVESIEEMEYGAEGFADMADYEQSGVLSCARNAVKMLEQLPLEILAAAGVDLSGLPSQDDIAGATPIERKRAA